MQSGFLCSTVPSARYYYAVRQITPPSNLQHIIANSTGQYYWNYCFELRVSTWVFLLGKPVHLTQITLLNYSLVVKLVFLSLLLHANGQLTPQIEQVKPLEEMIIYVRQYSQHVCAGMNRTTG